jgi:hypothetical protein
MKYFCLIFLLVCCSPALAAENAQQTPAKEALTYGVIDPQLLKTAYAGGEKMRYDIFWTGGVKIGELSLEIQRKRGRKVPTHEIRAIISTENGAIHGIYPVRDVHETIVLGNDRLPYRYEVRQKEGFNYQARRITRYDQKTGKIASKKNVNPYEVYWAKGPIHNEFSAFFSSRVMPFRVGESFLVPTFADKKRNEVKVKVVAKETLAETALGRVETMKVMPILQFKGLYDKNGDTVIWYTNDECRVPVRINSKLMIGSLTLSLVSYENTYCPKYSVGIKNQIPDTKKQTRKLAVAEIENTTATGTTFERGKKKND